MEEVRAEETFKLGAKGSNSESTGILPMSPWVEVQFRTNIVTETNLNKATPTQDNEWTTVSFRQADSSIYTPPTKPGDTSSLKFDNYFESVDLEDNGGSVKCNLTLFDKDLSRLENIIIKSMMATKGGNEIAMNSLKEATAKSILEFMPNPTSNINFRIRFGYSDPNGGDNVYRPALKSSPEWQERTTTGKKTAFYAQSPWLYFMMMGCNFNLMDKGLVCNVEGISMSNSFFDKTKIVKRFALMEGTPQKLFKDIADQIYLSTGGRVQVIKAEASGVTEKTGEPVLPDGVTKALGTNINYGEPSDTPVQWRVSPQEGSDVFPESISDEDRKTLEESSKWINISISLGGEPRYEVQPNGRRTNKIVTEFMSMKDLLNDFVSKVPPILKNKNTNEYITSPERIKEIVDNDPASNLDPTIFEPVPYTYSINEQTYDLESGADTDTIVVIRFFYRRLDNTKQQFIKTYDYRQSPSSIVTGCNVKNNLDFIQLNQSVIVKGKELEVYLSAPAKETDGNEGSSAADVTSKYQNQLQSDDFILVNRVENSSGDSTGSLLANKVVQNMNEGIFYGNLEILGDPFYLFDSNIQPMSYYIKLNVYRNYSEYNTSNIKILQKSYLSGYYLVKKISHKIDSSGFKTTLDIQRYPSTGIEV